MTVGGTPDQCREGLKGTPACVIGNVYDGYVREKQRATPSTATATRMTATRTSR